MTKSRRIGTVNVIQSDESKRYMLDIDKEYDIYGGYVVLSRNNKKIVMVEVYEKDQNTFIGIYPVDCFNMNTISMKTYKIVSVTNPPQMSNENILPYGSPGSEYGFPFNISNPMYGLPPQQITPYSMQFSSAQYMSVEIDAYIVIKDSIDPRVVYAYLGTGNVSKIHIDGNLVVIEPPEEDSDDDQYCEVPRTTKKI